MRCAFCKFNNPEGVTVCQVCGARLPVLICSRCYFENPPENRFCGGCGEPLPEVAAPESPRGRVRESRQTSPAALIGFGAVLALASVAFPWYLLGMPTSPEAASATISQLLTIGWQWFPGLPLALITIGTVVSTFLAILAGQGRPHPVAAVVVGLVMLFGAAWVSLSLQAPALATEKVPASTGPTLTIVGAIVIIATGVWLIRQPGCGKPRRPSRGKPRQPTRS